MASAKGHETVLKRPNGGKQKIEQRQMDERD